MFASVFQVDIIRGITTVVAVVAAETAIILRFH